MIARHTSWLLPIALAAALAVVPAHAADFDHWSLCMGRSGPAQAIKVCTAIIELGKELPDSLSYAYVYRGKAHSALKEGDLAFKDFSTALTFAPQLAHAHFGLGMIYKMREDWTHAAREFGRAAESQSEDADIDEFTADSEGSLRAASLSERGYALFKNGDTKQPLADFEAASELCPTCSAPYRDEALALDKQQKFSEAIAAADHAISLNTRSSPAFLVRGVVKAHMSKYDRAIADFSEAIRLYPTFALAYKARALAYGKLGKSKQAAGDDKIVARLTNGSAGELLSVSSSGVESAATVGPTLDDAALTALFSAKAWEARQGPWLATLEFRPDGGFRQHSKDQSEGSKLELEQDGAWSISQGQLCLYTNIALCLTGRVAGGNIVLTRRDSGTLEYSGSAAKLTDLKADAANFKIAEFPLEEMLLPGAPGAGKGGKKTLIYYIHGYEGRTRGHPPLPQYFVEQIRQSEGWDLIDGSYPQSLDSQAMRHLASNFGAASFVARRIKELKAQGYDRIFVGGQSWGGWTSLALGMLPDLPLDSLILVAPACCGWKLGVANTDDPNYANNKLLFDQSIEHVLYPTVGIFFSGDEFEPADRGEALAETLTKHGLPNLIINHPPGFEGHGSAWIPVFDYVYRQCIVNFLQRPKTTQCPRRAIATSGRGDFRAILTAGQIGDWHGKVATLPEVLGRHFVVYPNGDLRNIVSAGQTEVKDYGMGSSLFISSFRGELYCIRARVKYDQPQTTDETCSKLIKWSDHELLALDEHSGDVLQWWVERR